MASISEIRNTLEWALGQPDVYISAPNGHSGDDDRPYTAETDRERITRYWIYWHEFSNHIPTVHKRLILNWCMFKNYNRAASLFRIHAEQAKQIIEIGLADVSGSIYDLTNGL